QEKVFEIEMRESFGQRVGLGIDELKLAAALDHYRRGSFGADAYPIDTRGRLECAVGLDRDGKTMRVHGLDQGFIELQQRFAAGKDDVTVSRVGPPRLSDGVSQQVGRGELAPAHTVDPDKIGVAKCAGGTRAIGLAARPEVAPGKTAEHSSAPSVR